MWKYQQRFVGFYNESWLVAWGPDHLLGHHLRSVSGSTVSQIITNPPCFLWPITQNDSSGYCEKIKVRPKGEKPKPKPKLSLVAEAAASMDWKWWINSVMLVGNFWVRQIELAHFEKHQQLQQTHTRCPQKELAAPVCALLAKLGTETPSSGTINVKNKDRLNTLKVFCCCCYILLLL